jgi:hypothetical protein
VRENWRRVEPRHELKRRLVLIGIGARGIKRPSAIAGTPMMVREDRRLRLQGCEVYRFGGDEFVDLEAGEEAARIFFADLLSKATTSAFGSGARGSSEPRVAASANAIGLHP